MSENDNQALVLVINCGSSSLKFAIIAAKSGHLYLNGLAESLSLPSAQIHWKVFDYNKQLLAKKTAPLSAQADHTEALQYVVNQLLSEYPSLAKRIVAIGHRIVHGGEKITQSCVITPQVIDIIQEASVFAPLHNPAHILGINAATKAFPDLAERQVAVFDTAFHQTMPESAYLYALPYSLYTENSIRRYGAHGTSHQYVTQQAAAFLQKPIDEVHLISCHLGNGCSVTAIANGKSVDTSMGLTPLEGLVMGTRSGDLDPAIVFYLYKQLGYSIEEIDTMLTKKSGLLGLTSSTNDFRYIEENYGSAVEATRAFEVFVHRLAKYIAGYTACLSGSLDAIIFTGGIGENAVQLRAHVLKKLGLLGFALDENKNQHTIGGITGVITRENSPLALVIPTNEEWMIAKETAAIFQISI